MQNSEMEAPEKKTFFQKRRKLIIAVGAIFLLLLGCCVATQLFNGEEAVPEEIVEEAPEGIVEEDVEPVEEQVEPTDTPEPTPTLVPLADSYEEMEAAVDDLTDAQWRVYREEQEGRRVEEWTGWVSDVKQQRGDRYELQVDMAPPETLLSVYNVTFEIEAERALEVSKEQQVVFSGVIKSVRRLLLSLTIELEDVTWDIVE